MPPKSGSGSQADPGGGPSTSKTQQPKGSMAPSGGNRGRGSKKQPRGRDGRFKAHRDRSGAFSEHERVDEVVDESRNALHQDADGSISDESSNQGPVRPEDAHAVSSRASGPVGPLQWSHISQNPDAVRQILHESGNLASNQKTILEASPDDESIEDFEVDESISVLKGMHMRHYGYYIRQLNKIRFRRILRRKELDEADPGRVSRRDRNVRAPFADDCNVDNVYSWTDSNSIHDVFSVIVNGMVQNIQLLRDERFYLASSNKIKQLFVEIAEVNWMIGRLFSNMVYCSSPSSQLTDDQARGYHYCMIWLRDFLFEVLEMVDQTAGDADYDSDEFEDMARGIEMEFRLTFLFAKRIDCIKADFDQIPDKVFPTAIPERIAAHWGRLIGDHLHALSEFLIGYGKLFVSFETNSSDNWRSVEEKLLNRKFNAVRNNFVRSVSKLFDSKPPSQKTLDRSRQVDNLMRCARIGPEACGPEISTGFPTQPISSSTPAPKPPLASTSVRPQAPPVGSLPTVPQPSGGIRPQGAEADPSSLTGARQPTELERLEAIQVMRPLSAQERARLSELRSQASMEKVHELVNKASKEGKYTKQPEKRNVRISDIQLRHEYTPPNGNTTDPKREGNGKRKETVAKRLALDEESDSGSDLMRHSFRQGGDPPDSDPSSSSSSSSSSDSSSSSSSSEEEEASRRRRRSKRRRKKGFVTPIQPRKFKLPKAKNAASRYIADATALANKTIEVPEEFDKKKYYKSLPPPWNVLPRTNVESKDDLNKIKMFLQSGKDGESKRLRRFDGMGTQYFTWRSIVISTIHRANISVEEKCQYLCECIAHGVDQILDSVLEQMVPNEFSYVFLIGNLEEAYGGTKKALLQVDAMVAQVHNLNPDKPEDIPRIAILLARYVDFCQRNSLSKYLKPGKNADEFMSKCLTPQQHLGFLKYCRVRGMESEHEDGSIYMLRAYFRDLQELSRKVNDHRGVQSVTIPSRVRRERKHERKQRHSSKKHHKNRQGFTFAVNDAQESDDQDQDDDFDDEEDPDWDDSDSESEPDFDDDPKDNDRSSVSPLEEDAESGCILLCGSIAYDEPTVLALADTGRFTMPICYYCKPERHLLFMCPKFKALDLQGRREVIQKGNRCFNCLSPKHRTQTCPSKKFCQLCDPSDKRRHHTSLCRKGPEGPLPEYSPKPMYKLAEKKPSANAAKPAAYGGKPGKYVQQSRKNASKQEGAHALYDAMVALTKDSSDASARKATARAMATMSSRSD